MKAIDLLRGRPRQPVHGIDRVLRDVQTGHFERSLSALTAAGALLTAAEIYFEHDSASFGNKMMWLPVVLGPVGARESIGGFRANRVAKRGGPLTPHQRGRVAGSIQHGAGPAAPVESAGDQPARNGIAEADPEAGVISGHAGW